MGSFGEMTFQEGGARPRTGAPSLLLTSEKRPARIAGAALGGRSKPLLLQRSAKPRAQARGSIQCPALNRARKQAGLQLLLLERTPTRLSPAVTLIRARIFLEVVVDRQ